MTSIIRSLGYLAVGLAYCAIAAAAWFCYVNLGLMWSIIAVVVLFPLVLVFINLCTFPANALMAWATHRELQEMSEEDLEKLVEKIAKDK